MGTRCERELKEALILRPLSMFLVRATKTAARFWQAMKTGRLEQPSLIG